MENLYYDAKKRQTGWRRYQYSINGTGSVEVLPGNSRRLAIVFTHVDATVLHFGTPATTTVAENMFVFTGLGTRVITFDEIGNLITQSVNVNQGSGNAINGSVMEIFDATTCFPE